MGSTPSAVLLEELGLLPLQVFWGRLLNRFVAAFKVADSPVELLFHAILLDNLMMRFHLGTMPGFFLFICWQSIGQPMPHDKGVVPFLEVDTVVKALRQHLSGAHDPAFSWGGPYCWGCRM